MLNTVYDKSPLLTQIIGDLLEKNNNNKLQYSFKSPTSGCKTYFMK